MRCCEKQREGHAGPAKAEAGKVEAKATFLGLRSPVFGALAPREMQDPDRTGGDSGVPWGTAGVWLEPYSEQEARRTINIIDRHWHRQDRRVSSSDEELVPPPSHPRCLTSLLPTSA